jgi:hypothetical protein
MLEMLDWIFWKVILWLGLWIVARVVSGAIVRLIVSVEESARAGADYDDVEDVVRDAVRHHRSWRTRILKWLQRCDRDSRVGRFLLGVMLPGAARERLRKGRFV